MHCAGAARFLAEQITTPSLLSLPLASPKTATAPTTPTATSGGGSWFTYVHGGETLTNRGVRDLRRPPVPAL